MKLATASLLFAGFALCIPAWICAEPPITIPRLEGRFVNLVDGVFFCSGTIQAETGYKPETAFATARVSENGSFLFTDLEIPPGARNIDFRGSIFPKVENAVSIAFPVEALSCGGISSDSLLVLYNPANSEEFLGDLPLLGCIEGRVTDRTLGNPVSNATISMVVFYKSSLDTSAPSRMEYEVSTNGTGTYKLTESRLYRDIAGLHPGRLHIRGHVLVTDLRASALGYHEAPYRPREASSFRLLSNTYTRDFQLERIEDEW
jgi:hypothetical protein